MKPIFILILAATSLFLLGCNCQEKSPREWLKNYLLSTRGASTPSAQVASNSLKKLGIRTSWRLIAWAGKDSTAQPTNGTFMVDLDFNDYAKIPAFKLKGAVVICYYSAGTIEDYREDYASNKQAWDEISLKAMGEWPDERWLDLSKFEQLKALMKPRLDYAKSIGCDGVEPDNVDCFHFPEECFSLFGNGKGVSQEEAKALQIQYNKWTAEYAHSIGLIIGLKNAGDIINDMVDLYDFSVVESCYKWKECEVYTPFIKRGKAVFAVEYQALTTKACAAVTKLGIQIKHCVSGSDGNICTQPLKNCPFSYSGV